MSQNDFSIANAGGATVRADINSALQALASLSSGASAPSTTYGNQLWIDTTNGVLKRRDNGDTAWIVVDTMDEARVLPKSSAYTVQLRDTQKIIEADSTSAGFTLSLPAAASSKGLRVHVKAVGTGGNSVTLDPDAAETINGASTLVLSDGEFALAECDGTDWVALVTGTAAQVIPPSGSILAHTAGLAIAPNVTNPNFQIDISADEALLVDSDGNTHTASSISLTGIDITTSGAGGLDTGAEAADTWYYIWLGYNGSTVNGLLSASKTIGTITKPSGYTFFALVGAVRNNGSSNFLDFAQQGNLVAIDRTTLVSSGSATTDTSVSLAAVAPPDAVKLEFTATVNVTSGSTSQAFIRPISGSLVGIRNVKNPGGTVTMSVPGDVMIKTSQTIYYSVNASVDRLTLEATGYQW